MHDLHSMVIIAVVATVTMLLRFIPFAVFGRNKRTPDFWKRNTLVSIVAGTVVYMLLNMLSVVCQIQFLRLGTFLISRTKSS